MLIASIQTILSRTVSHRVIQQYLSFFAVSPWSIFRRRNVYLKAILPTATYTAELGGLPARIIGTFLNSHA